MYSKDKIKISRFLSLILRHHPEKIGISLDSHGWANVQELIRGVNRRYPLTTEMLEEIVRTDDKQRYSFSEDGQQIRANQGHSIPVDVELEKVSPPEILYHGTGEKYTARILQQGLLSKGRLYVHLSGDVPTAEKVGVRHGRPVIFAVKAGEMERAGYDFYRSVNGVWLVKKVPPEYVQIYSIPVDIMREADARTIAGGVPGKELMYRAAEGVYHAYPDWKGKRIAIIVGGGNNGGDGYALAVILKRNGISPEIFMVSDKKSDDGAYYSHMAREEGVAAEAYDDTDFSEYNVIVDCILGTGFLGTVRGNAGQAIKAINQSDAYVISVDMNSGMNGDTGLGDLAVRSDLTVSIGYYKHGMFKGRSSELIGRLTNVDIGIQV